MTAPVQEPTAERTVGGAYWATSQLARRPPPPGGTCPCDLDWAVGHGEGEISISDNTNTNAHYTSVAIAPGSTCFTADSTLHPFKIIKDGWYQFWLNNWFTGSDNGEYATGLNYSGAGFFENTDNTNLPRTSFTNQNNALNINLFNGWSPGPLYVHQPLSMGTYVRVKIGGSPPTAEIGPLTAVYLGPGLGLPADGSTTINDLYVSL